MSRPTAAGTGAKNARPQSRPKPPEITQSMRARALEARRAKALARKVSSLRRDFADAHHWAEMASKRGIELPPWGEPLTPGLMERWLRLCGMSVPEYFGLAGETSLSEFKAQNPQWPARAWAGLVLEWLK